MIFRDPPDAVFFNGDEKALQTQHSIRSNGHTCSGSVWKAVDLSAHVSDGNILTVSRSSEIDHQPLHKISFGLDGRYPERNLVIVIR